MEIVLKALAIPEILALILSYLPTTDSDLSSKDLLHCALVSQSWKDTSLEVLWGCLKHLIPLFKIMAPVRVTEFTTIRFINNGPGNLGSRSPQVCEFEPHAIGERIKNWTRFRYYASFVGSAQITILTNHGMVSGHSRQYYHPQMIRQATSIARAMDSPLLHRATKLKLTVYDAESGEAAMELLHEGLQDLSLEWFYDASTSIPLLLLRMCHCSSGLNRLELKSPNPSTNKTIAPQLAITLRSMHNLKILQIPLTMVYPPVWHALHSMNLKSVFLMGGGVIPLTQSDLHFMAEGPSFMALTLAPREAETLFSSQSCSQSISRFHITIDPIGAGAPLSSLLLNIPAVLPNTKSLSIILRGDPLNYSGSSFGPLGQMALTKLNIQLPNFDLFPDQGFERIFCFLPEIMHLKLLPSSLSTPRATLRTLGFIAEHCRNIRSVAIRLDCTKSALPSTSFPRPFGPCLEKLDMEFSPVEDEMAVAMTLIPLFPEGIPDIQSSPISFGHARLQYQHAQSSTEFTSRWQGVHSALQALRRIIQSARAQDLERLAELETQLKTQDRLLFEAHSRLLELEGGFEGTDPKTIDGE
ncbi:hypothetical protein DL93DRAFT_2231099 [Clavulina sp. PMI_390]|nr:hypothetical protein DL93DRAFT_2231099 [Clavulina sp. PMI_390]